MRAATTLFLLVTWLTPYASGIFGGADAPKGQYSYIVSYQAGLFGVFEHVCGGVIISPTWILTAGRCVTQVPNIGFQFKIVAGVVDLQERSPERQDIDVTEKITHPDYLGSNGPNDIALLHLAKPLVFNDYIKPITLPSVSEDLSGSAQVSGWGLNQTSYPKILQTLTLPIIDTTDCRSLVGNLGRYNEETIFSLIYNVCTVDEELHGAGACDRDSGDPLVQNGEVIGIVSWSIYELPCGTLGAPTIYTKVDQFIDFISTHVEDLPL